MLSRWNEDMRHLPVTRIAMQLRGTLDYALRTRELSEDEQVAREYAAGRVRLSAVIVGRVLDRITRAFGLTPVSAAPESGELGLLVRRVQTRLAIDAGNAVSVDALAELAGAASSLLRRHRAEGRLTASGGSSGRGHRAWVSAREAARWLAQYAPRARAGGAT